MYCGYRVLLFYFKLTAQGCMSLFGLTLFALSVNASSLNIEKRTIQTYVVNPISHSMISPDENLSWVSNQESINLYAARGEYVPASFVLKAVNSDIEDFRPHISDLVSGENIISQKNIDLKLVKNWYQANGAWVSHGRTGLSQYQKNKKKLVSELLLNDDSLIDVNNSSNLFKLKVSNGYAITNGFYKNKRVKRHVLPTIEEFNITDSNVFLNHILEQGQNKQYWLTILIPKDAKRGIYSGEVYFQSGAMVLKEKLTIKIEVLPMDLEDTGMNYSLYYRGRLSDEGTISSEKKSRTQILHELDNIKNHGVDSITLYLNKINFNLLEETLNLYKNAGLTDKGVFIYSTNIEKYILKKNYKRLDDRLSEIKRITDLLEIKNVYIYGKDESDIDDVKNQKKGWVKIVDKGFKIFVSGKFNELRNSGGLIDIYVSAYKPLQEYSNEAHEHKKKIFSYANPQTGPENPEIFRMNYGALLWAYDYDGAMPYAYQDSFGFIYDDSDHIKYRDHCFTYPTSNNVIDTIAWEGYRKAIDDVRYIRTLERYIKIGENSVNTEVKKASINALLYLDKLRDKLKTVVRDKRTPKLNVDLSIVKKYLALHLIEIYDLNESQE